MTEIKNAAYFQFALGVLAIVGGVIAGGFAMWAFILIGLGMLAGGYFTLTSG